MTKREEQLQKDYAKALKNGNEMIKRACQLDEIADKIMKEEFKKGNATVDNANYVQALTIKMMVNEMRGFYEKMFN